MYAKQGAAIYIFGNNQVIVSDSIFNFNVAYRGGAVSLINTDMVLLTNNKF